MGTRAKESRYRLGGVFLGRRSLFSRRGGQRSVIKQDAGLERAGPTSHPFHSLPSLHLPPSPSPRLWQGWRVEGFCRAGGVTGDDSLALGPEERMCSSSTQQDFQEEETSFSTGFSDISLPSGGIYEPGPESPSSWRIKGSSAASRSKSESFIALSRQEQRCGQIKLAKAKTHVFAKTYIF